MQQGMVVNHSYASRGGVQFLACVKGWCSIACMHQGVVFGECIEGWCSVLHASRGGV